MVLETQKPSPRKANPPLGPARLLPESRSSDDKVPSGSSLSNHKRQYTPSEWQSKKAIIQELYLDKGQSLKHVMERLGKEPHNFHPTPKMYKDKLKIWELYKNCTEARVKKILHDKTAKAAVEKASKFDRNWEDAQKITKYLSRKKMTLPKFIATDNQTRGNTDATSRTFSKPATPNHQNITVDPVNSSFTRSAYEEACPYRPKTKMFRLVETFPNGAIYQGDSFGHRSYIDINEDRECGPQCLCRRHDIDKSDSFAFVVHKSQESVDVTLFSDSLHSELLTLLGPLDVAGCKLQQPHHQSTVNGLVLLKHYNLLQAHMEMLRSTSSQGQIAWSRVSEMELLVEGLLSDGEVFKSLGYESLYECGFLEYELWREFQQQRVERDIAALDGGFCAVDDTENPLTPDGSDSVSGLYDLSPDSRFSVDSLESIVGVDHNAEDLFQIQTSANATGANTEEMLSNLEGGDHHTESVHGIQATLTEEAVQSGNMQGKAEHERFNYELDDAAERGDKIRLRLVLARGANAASVGYYYPLIEAAAEGHEASVGLLLDRGAVIDCLRWNVHGLTPLLAAARGGHEAIVRLLLDRGADINRTACSGDSLTPLLAAASGGHEATVRLLLDRGADISRSDWNGNGLTPLIAAASGGHEATVMLLLDRGANMHRSSWNGNGLTPLLAAAGEGHEATVRLLLDRGADVNGQTFSFSVTPRTTPLAAAASEGHQSIVRLLLTRGATINAISGMCERLIDGGQDLGLLLAGAVRLEQETLVRVLLNRGADVQTALCVLQGCGATFHAHMLLKFVSRLRYNAEPTSALQTLRFQFMHQYSLLAKSGQNQSTNCRNSPWRFRTYRDAWGAGIRVIRGLCRGQRPENFYDAMAFLCLARAMAESLESKGHSGYLQEFLLDLKRWQLHFSSNPEELTAYQEAVYSMWGVVLSSFSQTEFGYEEALFSFQELASTLINHAKESFGLDILGGEGLEVSQQRWRERTGQLPSIRDQPTSTADGADYEVNGSHHRDPVPFLPSDTPPPATISPLKTRIKTDLSCTAVDDMVIVLMAGAVFAIMIVFLQVLRNILSGLTSNSHEVGGISSLQERCHVLENYLGLKPAVLSEVGLDFGEGDLYVPFP